MDGITIDRLELFERRKAEFKEHFAENALLFAGAEKAFRNLLAQLTDTEDFEQPKVISRIKDRDECIKKFTVKYQNDAEKKDNYQIKDYITDQIGVRVICLYETDIPKIEKIIRSNFEIISVTDKTQILLDDIRSFGYKGLHFDICLTNDRCALPEYSRFEGLRVELQLRSIVQDAWSEVEHKLRYKKQSPPSFQRRIIRLAALFELADQEFAALHEETEKLVLQAFELAERADQEFANLSGEGEAATPKAITHKNEDVAVVQAVPLDSFSFLAMISRFHPKYRFEAEAIDEFVDEIKTMDRGFSLGALKDAVGRFRDIVWDYKQFQRRNDVNINPFTEIRFVLYAYDKQKFEDMLFPNQREAFMHWLKGKNVDI